ncbi:MAG: type II toxin-antitoxin system VapC family toxin [bacterium]
MIPQFSLLKWLDIIEFDEEIAEMAGNTFIALKKQNKIIDYRDLFIGSTAVFYNLGIATLNIEHFENIPNIKIVNTSEI